MTTPLTPSEKLNGLLAAKLSVEKGSTVEETCSKLTGTYKAAFLAFLKVNPELKGHHKLTIPRLKSQIAALETQVR